MSHPATALLVGSESVTEPESIIHQQSVSERKSIPIILPTHQQPHTSLPSSMAHEEVTPFLQKHSPSREVVTTPDLPDPLWPFDVTPGKIGCKATEKCNFCREKVAVHNRLDATYRLPEALFKASSGLEFPVDRNDVLSCRPNKEVGQAVVAFSIGQLLQSISRVDPALTRLSHIAIVHPEWFQRMELYRAESRHSDEHGSTLSKCLMFGSYDRETLLFPTYLENHWFLIATRQSGERSDRKLANLIIANICSMGQSNDDAIAAAKDLFHLAHPPAGRRTKQQVIKLYNPPVPGQGNFYDCCIHMLHYLREFVAGPGPVWDQITALPAGKKPARNSKPVLLGRSLLDAAAVKQLRVLIGSSMHQTIHASFSGR